MQPGRAILVHFDCDWNLFDLALQKQMDKPKFYDLLTEYQILPLLANYTDEKGMGYIELKKMPTGNAMGLFLLRLPSGESVWFNAEKAGEEELYDMLKRQFVTHLEN